jgi:LPXTG-site transpeptidase (sortase) family protein
MLDIPRLSMSTPVVRGDDDATLQLAAGHLPDTPKPWEPGNSAIAGHRDGLFRPLKNIRVGDEVFVRTTRGDLRYRVSDTRIVTPDDLSVLRPTASHTLTLITCYPFYYVGSAPKRFIVHAERVDAGAPPAVQPISDDVQIVAAGPAVETPKVRKAKAKKVSVDKRKPRKALAKRPMEKKAAGKVVTPAPKPGKVRGFFRKIGSFFKKPKPRATPETPSR